MFWYLYISIHWIRKKDESLDNNFCRKYLQKRLMDEWACLINQKISFLKHDIENRFPIFLKLFILKMLRIFGVWICHFCGQVQRGNFQCIFSSSFLLSLFDDFVFQFRLVLMNLCRYVCKRKKNLKITKIWMLATSLSNTQNENCIFVKDEKKCYHNQDKSMSRLYIFSSRLNCFCINTNRDLPTLVWFQFFKLEQVNEILICFYFIFLNYQKHYITWYLDNKK